MQRDGKVPQRLPAPKFEEPSRRIVAVKNITIHEAVHRPAIIEICGFRGFMHH
jgi:hypothetical protein